MQIDLDERLNMLSALTPACTMAADVGADHGFLGAWLLQSGRCEKVQFLDISAPSLNKARRLIGELQLESRALFSVGDGLAALKEHAQAIIIAGMGGATISGILERGREHLSGARIIMQPNVDIARLRCWLQANKLRIVDEALARAGGRWYVGIAAEEGASSFSREELLVGPVLMTKHPQALCEYAAFRIRVLKKAYEGAVKGSKPMMTRELAEELAIWRETVQHLRV